MTARLYLHLLRRNFSANRAVWLPYLGAASLIIALTEIVFSLASDPYVQSRSSHLLTLINMSGIITVTFAAMFVWYASRFVNQSLSKEFNLYRVLGMERRHLHRLLLLIHFTFALTALGLGVLGGVLGGELFYLLLNRLMRDAVQMNFLFSSSGIYRTLLVFLVIFFISWVLAVLSTRQRSLIEKRRSPHRHEKVVSFLQALGAVLFIGIGYAIALGTENPVQSFQLFLVAALFVMVGTWLLFISVVVLVLRMLSRRKSLYYKPIPFITISGLLPRMRHHAWGLANITILLTMLTLTLSTTAALYSGVQETVHLRMPEPYQASFSILLGAEDADAIWQDAPTKSSTQMQKTVAVVKAATLAQNQRIDHLQTIHHLDGFGEIEGQTLKQTIFHDFTRDMPDMFIFLTAEEANLTAMPGTLQTVSFDPESILPSELHIGNTTWSTAPLSEEAGKHLINQTSGQTSHLMDGTVFVFPDEQTRTEALLSLHHETPEATWSSNGTVRWSLSEKNDDAAFNQAYLDSLRNQLQGDIPHQVEARSNLLAEWYQINGGLLFIGLVLSLVFLIGVLLITFFKQLAEGQADRARFVTMQELGMDAALIDQSLRVQIFTLFFLPLLITVIHTAFAFPMVRKLLLLMGLTQTYRFFIACGIVICVVALLYGLCYLITTRIYRQLITRS